MEERRLRQADGQEERAGREAGRQAGKKEKRVGGKEELKNEPLAREIAQALPFY